MTRLVRTDIPVETLQQLPVCAYCEHRIAYQDQFGWQHVSADGNIVMGVSSREPDPEHHVPTWRQYG